jgi:hypothetical protein
MSRYLPFEKEANFPNLRRGEYEVTSKVTAEYNCIAHAAERDDRWWWPMEVAGCHWPDGLAREETLEAFIAAYSTIGYEPTADNNHGLETGRDKIAIYTDADGVPTHAARQLPDGTWTSKLGQWEDIMHQTLEAMEDSTGLGLAYGKVALIMVRHSAGA